MLKNPRLSLEAVSSRQNRTFMQASLPAVGLRGGVRRLSPLVSAGSGGCQCLPEHQCLPRADRSARQRRPRPLPLPRTSISSATDRCAPPSVSAARVARPARGSYRTTVSSHRALTAPPSCGSAGDGGPAREAREQAKQNDVCCQRLFRWQLSGMYPGQLPPRASRPSSSTRAHSSPRPMVRCGLQSSNSAPLQP